MRLLLLSNSSNFGSGYLDHAAEEVRALFEGARRILFVPFALKDQEGYTQLARARFRYFGFEVDRLPEGDGARDALEEAEGVFVGGGNTFRLLDRLHRSDVIGTIRRRARDGMPYMGSSAGTVVACPTLMTTNDMPIVHPVSFEALGLVPFQINCHYLDADPGSKHMGETREQRIREFHEENDADVVGLREGAMLHLDDAAAKRVILTGTAGARLFRRGQAPAELEPGTCLDQLLRA